MEFEALRQFLNQMPETTEESPFGPQALVYKVCGKMFALVGWPADPRTITLKCDPVLALHLRDHYSAVNPGYYMNKKHWNTITLEDDLPDPELIEMIKDSFGLVVKGLKRADRERLDIASL